MDSFGNYPREKFDPFSLMLFKGLQVVACCILRKRFGPLFLVDLDKALKHWKC